LRRHAGEAASAWASAGGEDYELLLAIPPRVATAFERACSRAGERVTPIGELSRGRGVILMDPYRGEVPTPAGFDHFAAAAPRIDRPSHHK
jgi:thiamine-monophosphate kinase